MERILNRNNGLVWVSLMLIVLVQGLAPAGALDPLDNLESDGFLQWFHSLEQTVKAREKAGTAEGNLLYPFDQPGWEIQEHRPYRHLAISKAIMELEAQWLLRGESQEESALVALAHARNYTNLSEFDSAMVWYQAAAKLDSLSLFKREIGREHLAVASAIGDSLSMMQLITNTMGLTDLAGREQELILAYRWLLTNQDSEGLDLLLARVESQPEIMSEQVLFWHAYSQAWREKRASSLLNLRRLVKSGGLSEDLTESQRAWVLVSIPDLMFLLGDKELSLPLYQTIQAGNMEFLRTWATYQIANLEFLNSHYGKAANGFDLVCEARRLGGWQDQACEMAKIARDLERIRTEGEPYGAAQFYNP